MTDRIIIAGAGLTGRLMALALAHEGLSSLIIDPVAGQNAPRDGRTTALAYAGVRMMIRLGLWDQLNDGAGAINDILVTNGVPQDHFRKGGTSGGALHFPATLLPDDRRGYEGLPLGYVIENAVMNDVFEAAVQANDLIDTQYGTAVTKVERTTGTASVTTTDGDTLSTPLLIACDGKFSPLRRMLGFRMMEWEYGQKALTFNISHTEDHQGIAHELFYPGGPFAILPLDGKACSIVWTEKTATADALMALSPDDLLAEAKQRIGSLLGELNIITTPSCYPLRFGYATTPAMDRVALAGDASHTIHPIAGQGFNLGVKDAAALSDVLGNARRAGLDLGHGAVLDEYVQWRRFDTASMSLGTDVINRLFSNDIAPIRWARGLGLGLVQKIDPLRMAFMRQSGADTGTLPSLLQPL